MILENVKVRFNDKVAAFILGLSVCEGITTFLKIGSTAFTLSEIIAPLLFLYFLVTRTDDIKEFIKNVPWGFKLFFAVIILSVISGFLYFMSLGILYRYAVGLIYLLISFSMAMDVFVLRESKDWLIKGLLWGLVANLVFSLICYFSFNMGTVLTLEGLVNRESGFYVPSQSFRTQGFFLEPSHFIRFVASIFLIVAVNNRIRGFVIKLLIILAGVAAILLSTSGSVVIMAIGLIAYWLFRRREVRNNALTVLFIIGVVGLVVLFIILNSETAMTIEDLVNNIILGADITDEGNSERFSSMLESLSYIKDAVFGCGWNLVSNLFEAHESNMIASFSDVLEMTLELGIHGIIIYIVSLVALMFKLLRHGSNNSVALCMSLGVIFMLQVGTDYAFDPCIMLVFGLCIIELWERRSQIEAEV